MTSPTPEQAIVVVDLMVNMMLPKIASQEGRYEIAETLKQIPRVTDAKTAFAAAQHLGRIKKGVGTDDFFYALESTITALGEAAYAQEGDSYQMSHLSYVVEAAMEVAGMSIKEILINGASV